jgi:hypothetical protein
MKNHTQIVERKNSKRPSRTQTNLGQKLAEEQLQVCTQRALRDAIDGAAALLETVTALFEELVSERNELLLKVDTIYGLRKLAEREGRNLNDRFDSFLVAHRITS